MRTALLRCMTVGVAVNILELKGEGAEYLLDRDGNVLAEFYNGNLVTTTLVAGNNEETKV
jgi:hypothetical protein